jgi:hypothetical protein
MRVVFYSNGVVSGSYDMTFHAVAFIELDRGAEIQ